MPPHFALLHRLDVQPLVRQLDENPGLWDQNTLRQSYPGSAHADTQCIFVRGPLGFTPQLYFNDLGCCDFLSQRLLTEAMPLVEQTCALLGSTQLGRVLIVKLRPGGFVTPHVDEGKYAEHFARLHIVLTTNEQCTNVTDGVSEHWRAGSVWWFNHKLRHAAVNEGSTDRIHMIVDVVPSPVADNLSA